MKEKFKLIAFIIYLIICGFVSLEIPPFRGGFWKFTNDINWMRG